VVTLKGPRREVEVGLETMKQIESQLLQPNYEGILR